MKKLLLLFVFFSIPALAADLNLSTGEVVVIRANENTRVACNDKWGTTCDSDVQAFNLRMSSCLRSYGGGYCAEKYWPSFRSTSPRCVSLGLGICLETCQQSYGGGRCAEICQ